MVQGLFYDGRRAGEQLVRLDIRDGELCLEGAAVRRYRLADVDFGEPLQGAPRCIELADGARCEVADERGLAALLRGAGLGESLVVRLQKRWRWAIVSLLLVVAGGAAAYFAGLPALARALAPLVPDAVVSRLSGAVLAQLDQRYLVASHLPEQQRAAIRKRAAAFLGTADTPKWRLHFRASPRLGANAFALPGGDLVLLDALVERLEPAQIDAVLAHELGHLVHRHAMRQLIQGAVVSVALAAWFGDVSSAAVSVGSFLLQSGYSRDAEREADAYAAHRLLVCCGSVEPLVQALGKLDVHASRPGPELFNTHPDTDQRIQAIRQLKP
jgi:Zn-dependent protease with chaperone function